MTDNTQPEALDLANWLEAVGGGPSAKRCAALLREQHARISELEAQLEAIGAGGVQALSAAPVAKKSALRTYPNPIVPLIKPVSEQEKMRALYLASSNLMAYLGRNGAVHSDGHAADVLMNCLNDLDGGEFDETLFAASPTPPAEQPIGEVVVTKAEDGQIVAVTRQDDEGRILSVIATSGPAEQQAAPKAAPSEGGDETDWYHGITEKHFDRAVQKAVQRDRASRAATPKAAPGEPTQEMIASVMSLVDLETSDPEDRRYDDGSKLAAQICRAVLALAPQQEPVAIKAMGYGGSTGINDYLMSDGTIKAMRPSEVVWAAPQPAPAPLSEMPYEKRKAIQEGEQIGASDAWFKARHEMLDTVDRRNVFRAGFDRGWSAALAEQGGK